MYSNYRVAILGFVSGNSFERQQGKYDKAHTSNVDK